MNKKQLEAEVKRCHERLGITHLWVQPDDGDDLVSVPIPMNERAAAIDGIDCRDESINLLQGALEEAYRKIREISETGAR